MTKFNVTIERPGRSRKATALRLFGFDARHLAMFAGAYIALGYVVWFANGGSAHPIDLLYVAAFVILTLMISPGLLVLAAFCEMAGLSHDFDTPRLIVVMLISAAIYGFEVRRGLLNRNGQTPYESAAD